MAVSDLTGTTWVLNNTLSAEAGYGIFAITYSYDDVEGSSLGIGYGMVAAPPMPPMFNPVSDSIADEWNMAIMSTGGGTLIIIEGADVANPSLIAWLEANAVQQGGDDALTVRYNNELIWSGSSGNITLPTNGKLMSGDITFELVESGGGGVTPPPTPEDAVIFYSLKSFILRTYNGAKNWNGTLQYSTDNSSWSTWGGTTELTATQSDGWYKLYLRGSSNTYLTTGSSKSSSAYWVFAGSGITCDGNLNKLLNYSGSATLGNYAFAHLFYGCGNIDFNVTLPATTLATYCYQSMFRDCTSLTTAPALPASTLYDYCYSQMFYGCKSLTTAPTLPATTLATYCYNYMFYNCASLTTVPALPATTLANYCYYYMFAYCPSLITIPALPATTFMQNCYYGMFYSCSKIKMSTSQTGEYQTPYRIPTSGTGTTASAALSNMFYGTGGTLTGTPSINTTYYTSNTVIS